MLDQNIPESSSRPRWQAGIEWAAALALAAVWLVAGLWKLSDLTATQLRMTQFLVPQPVSFAAAAFFGTAETFSALLLLVPQWRRWGAGLSVFLLAAFMAYIGIHYRQLTGAECSCFPWMKRAIGPSFFVEDAGLIVLAVVAGWWASPSRGFGRAAAALASVVVLAAGLQAADRTKASGALAPPSVIADGHEFPLQQGRVLLFFFNPYCPHCLQAAQAMSRLNWQATIIGIPTQNLEEGPSFFASAGLTGVRLSPDIVRLRPIFPFEDAPYGVAVENGRVKEKLVFFDEPDLSKTLRRLGFIH